MRRARWLGFVMGIFFLASCGPQKEPDPTNQAPVAVAGADQDVLVGASVDLSGSDSSDPDGQALSFQWTLVTLPAGSSAAFSDATAVGTTFVADRPGTYEIELVVNDGTDSSAPDTLTVTSTPLNVAPTADAGPDQQVAAGATVFLDGSGSSDPDGGPVTYLWTVTSRPAGSLGMLSSSTVVDPTFVANLPGEYLVELEVRDGDLTSAPDTLSVVATLPNTAPSANAGVDRSVATGATVSLDGSGSTDPEGDALTHLWSLETLPVGSSAVLSEATAAAPTFLTDLDGDYVAQLIVNDGVLDSPPVTVAITAVSRAWQGASLVEAGDGDCSSPQVAFDPAGRAGVTWRQETPTVTSVLVRFHDGVSWGTEALLETDDINDAWENHLAFGQAGRLGAVWEQSDGVEDSVWATMDDGLGWSAPALLETAAEYTSDPRLGFVTGTDAVAVWRQQDPSVIGKYLMYSNHYTLGAWGAAELIGLPDGGFGESPWLGCDGAGSCLAVWEQGFGFENNIYFNLFSAGAWGGVTPLELAAGNAWSPRVSMDASGEAMATWIQYDGSIFQVWARHFDGSAWGSATLISSTTDRADATDIAASGGGTFFATWQQSSGSSNDIWVRRFTGGAWEAPQMVDAENLTTSEARIAADPSGGAVVIWRQRFGIRYDLVGATFDGSTWGLPQLLELQNTQSVVDHQVSMDGSGRALVVWAQSDGTRRNIWSNRYR